MKVLWVTNILPHFLAIKLNEKTISRLGWLDYSAEKLIENENISLCVLCPGDAWEVKTCDNVECYTFPSKFLLSSKNNYSSSEFKNILLKISPDIIHIYGTEYFHTLAIVKAAQSCGMLNKTIISIQGLISVCAKHYLAGLPYKATTKYTVRDFLKRENTIGKMKEFEHRGKGEIEALSLARNVIGRTEWDKACTKQINPNINYFLCNETLRKTFYEGKWDFEKCEKHSIFVSQSSYALKGMHQVVEALPLVIKQYPNAKVYVTGEDVFKKKWYRITSYHNYLKKRIVKLGLRDKVVFLGALDEEQMKKRFLDSNVFVSASSVENSPNSLGEAMILGLPCISSDVGGVSDMLVHKKEGFLYPYDAPYMLAHYICRIFGDSDEAKKIGKNANIHATATHSPNENFNVLYEIYMTLERNQQVEKNCDIHNTHR